MEQDIATLVKAEFDRREAEKQAKCRHARSATFFPDGKLLCDQCDYALDPQNPDYGYEIDSGRGTVGAISRSGGGGRII